MTAAGCSKSGRGLFKVIPITKRVQAVPFPNRIMRSTNSSRSCAVSESSNDKSNQVDLTTEMFDVPQFVCVKSVL